MATENQIERTIGLVLLTVLAIGCILVLRPFFTAVCFALILVVATWPAFVNDTTWSTIVRTWRPGRLELYVDGWSRASSTAAATNTSALFGIYRWGWSFSTSQDFNGDIALIACFASSWTPAMVRRWHADPFGFLRAWGEVPALMGSASPATPPSTGTGVVVCLMG